jgi:hypothetical protein
MGRAQILPVGVVEISERVGVRQQTVAQWRVRGVLPPPRWIVSRQPAWNWPDIEAWANDRRSIGQPDQYSFRLFISLEGVDQASAEQALEAAGAQLPIAWRDRRTQVAFRRGAPNFSEAVAYVVNSLPPGIDAEGLVRPLAGPP